MTETIPQPNVLRLIHLAEWVGSQQARKDLGIPSEWDQENWLTWLNGELLEFSPCGTAACIAGKTALEDGGIPFASTWDYNASANWGSIPVGPLAEAEVGETGAFIQFGDDPPVEVNVYAQQALGLNDDEADALFDENNDYDRVIQVVRSILDDDYR